MINPTMPSPRDCLAFYPKLLTNILKRAGMDEDRLCEVTRILNALFPSLLADENNGGLCTTLGAVNQLLSESDAAKEKSSKAINPISQEDLTLLIDAGLAADSTNDTLGIVPLVIDFESDVEATRIYLMRSFVAEKTLATTILTLLKTPREITGKATETIKRLLAAQKAETALEKQSLKEREAAMTLVLKNNFSLIHGGPGTGKTTAVAGILECLLSENPLLTIRLAAPTGKAASRVLESILGTIGNAADLYPNLALRKETLKAETLHRMLYTVQPETGEKPSAKAPLLADVLVIDEASMIGTLLAKTLFETLSTNTRVILMGDADQLSAVEPGSAFADLSSLNYVGDEKKEFSARLNVSWRFNDESVFGVIAHAVNNGDAEKFLSILKAQESTSKLKAHIEGEDTIPKNALLSEEAKLWVKTQMSAYVKVLLELVGSSSEVNLNEVWKHFPNFRALAARHSGFEGVDALNEYADTCRKELLTEHFGNEAWKDSYGEDFGKLLLITRNNSSLDVYNGDIGVVLPHAANENARLYIGDRNKVIYLGQVSDLELAFALSIHKSQGSEYANVAVFLPVNDDSPILSRELLYTAITRIKDSVSHPGELTLFSSEKSFIKAIATKAKRNGGLKKRCLVSQV